ncbi:MAG: hypothetical protein JXR83_18450 [Deltaproteobacteria bacterium]|nr:hypothetical protein [Deltaproteobacteria bacterium]
MKRIPVMLMSLAIAMAAVAQDAPAPTPAPTPVPEPPPVAAPPEAPEIGSDAGGSPLRLSESINLKPEEMLKEAQKYLEEMRQALARALEVLTKARESKDVIRLNCVNEKLTPMKGILKIAEDAFIGLQENIATGNREAAGYEYSKIKISHEKISTLLVQAINCVGAEATYSGDTELSVDIDDEIAGGDPYYGDPQILVDPTQTTVDGKPGDEAIGEEPNVVVRPPVASPIR